MDARSVFSTVEHDRRVPVAKGCQRMVGKRVQFDDATWNAINLLRQERRRSFQQLADEAFRDLLDKHGQPTKLKDQLKGSLKSSIRSSPSSSAED